MRGIGFYTRPFLLYSMRVPEFQPHISYTARIVASQQKFYDYLCSSIENGIYPSVEGNVAYLFRYIYDFRNKSKRIGFEQVRSRMMEIANAYYFEERLCETCYSFADNCLLGLERYDEYLSKTAPKNIFGTARHKSNLHCNINYHIGKPANPIDLVKMYEYNYSAYVKQNEGKLKDFLMAAFEKNIEEYGSLLERFYEIMKKPRRRYKYPLGLNIYSKFYIYEFCNDNAIGKSIKLIIRFGENEFLKSQGLPGIGQGWISETILYQKIKEAFPETTVIQHGRPNWLGRQHLDIWLPDWRIAVEYHGLQHFQPVEFFGGVDAFEDSQYRDKKKEQLCKINNVHLIISFEGISPEEIIERIKLLRSIR